MPDTATDLYAELGVPSSATAEQLHQAYLALARSSHPDVNRAADAEQRFKRINAAYATLSNPEKRARYDLLGANWERHDPVYRDGPSVDAMTQTADVGYTAQASWLAFDVRRAALVSG